jgi:predicted RNA-binding Zn-ribbon protein involved in translation (DUF1610 family)
MRVETLHNHFFNSKNPYIRMHGVENRMKHRDICPKCYNLTLTDTRKGDAVRKYKTCPVCGWHGPASATMTFAEVLKQETVIKNGELHLR